MRVAYLECFAGVSGDMMLGALVDAGVARELLERTATSLGLGAEVRFTRVDRSGISPVKVDVLVTGELADQAPDGGPHEHVHPPEHPETHSHDHAHARQHPQEHLHEHRRDHLHEHGRRGDPAAPTHHHEHHDPDHGHHEEHVHHQGDDHHHHGRGLTEIRALITNAGLRADATSLALRAFELLAASESKIHNVPAEQIHFHEVGAVDAIVDIVCSAVGLCSLGVDRWVCSPLNVGGGFVDCAHGRFPVPAPATADLLRGAPTYSSGIMMELVTPTGAALVRALGCSFGDVPLMNVATIGYGAGTRDPKRFPNVLRLSIGESVAAVAGANAGQSRFASETITVLECAVDDMNPQVLAHCAQLALDRGALDAMTAPVTMKKGRLGSLLTVLCRQERAAEFEELLFRGTSTLGIRVRQEERVYLERRTVDVDTEYGSVRMKVGSRAGEYFNAQPEFEDCRRLAERAGAPLKEVIEAARAAYMATATVGAMKA